MKDGSKGLSRREVLGATTLAATGDAWIVIPAAAQSTDSVRFILRRPSDLLVLGFEVRNAVVHNEWLGERRIRRHDQAKPFVAVVAFPSQHVDEEAFLETMAHEPPGAVPVWSQASGPSRLCFDVDLAELQMTPEALLDWREWKPRVAPEIVAPDQVREPDELTTAVELPTRLTISATDAARWVHGLRPVERNGRTEIWHTRLYNPSGAVAEIRAIWSPDYRPGAMDTPPPWEPKTTPLDAQDRNGFVHSTHVGGFDPEPIPLKTLALSSAGGWLSFEKRWAESVKRQGYPISWKQRTSLGRDTYTEVDRLAFLYPFGFKVSVVKTTERKVQDVRGEGQDAFLRQHFTIKFEEPFKDFDDWRWPFVRLTPVKPETPYLDIPTSFAFPGAPAPDWRQGAFWPEVLGSPYEFEFLATDKAGQVTHFTAPLICVPLLNIPPDVADPRLPQVQAEYLRDPRRSTRPFYGQSVAFGTERARQETSHPVQQIALDGELVPPHATTKIESPFRPLMASTQIASAVATALGGGTAENLAWFTPADPSATATEVYLLADGGRSGSMEVSFVGQSDRAGGIAAPKMIVGGFGRATGPFGHSPPAAAPLAVGIAAAPTLPAFLNNTFDPSDFLHDDAAILGVKLSSILKVVAAGAAEAAPRVLSLLEQNIDDIPTFTQSFDWLTENLQDTPALGIVAPILLTQQESPDNVLDANTPTRFSITAQASLGLFSDQPPTVEAYGRLSNFSIQLAVDIGGEANGVLLKIGEAWFRTRLGEKPEFGIDLRSAEMIGPVLQFIQRLEEEFAPALSHAAQMIDISPGGVRVTLPPFDVPPLSLGALDVSGLSITSSVSLPFDQRKPAFTFDFSTPQNQFLVAVGIFGGCGYVSVTLDTDGIQALSASFQFGGYRALELGVVRGRVFLFGGLFYSSARLTGGWPGSTMTLSAFVHAGGEASVFSIVTVSVDFYVGLTQQSGPNYSVLYGEVTLTYSVKIGFFSRSASVHYTHTIQGSRNSSGGTVAALSATAALCASPPRAVNAPVDLVSLEDWIEYHEAFAQ